MSRKRKREEDEDYNVEEDLRLEAAELGLATSTVTKRRRTSAPTGDGPKLYYCVCGVSSESLSRMKSHKSRCRQNLDDEDWVPNPTKAAKAMRQPTSDQPQAAALPTASAELCGAMATSGFQRRRRYPESQRLWEAQPGKNKELTLELEKVYRDRAKTLESELRQMEATELAMARYKVSRPEDVAVPRHSWRSGLAAIDASKFKSPKLADSRFTFVSNLNMFGLTPESTYASWLRSFITTKETGAISRSEQWSVLPLPTICGASVNLFYLYREVVSNGGLAATLSKRSIWLKVAKALKLIGTKETLYFQLRCIYFAYLLAFEQHFQVMHLSAAKSLAARCKPRAKGSRHKVQLSDAFERDYQWQNEERLEEMKQMKHASAICVLDGGVLDDFHSAPTRRLVQSLRSGLTSEIHYALNRLLFMTYGSVWKLAKHSTADLLGAKKRKLQPVEIRELKRAVERGEVGKFVAGPLLSLLIEDFVANDECHCGLRFAAEVIVANLSCDAGNCALMAHWNVLQKTLTARNSEHSLLALSRIVCFNSRFAADSFLWQRLFTNLSQCLRVSSLDQTVSETLVECIRHSVAIVRGVAANPRGRDLLLKYVSTEDVENGSEQIAESAKSDELKPLPFLSAICNVIYTLPSVRRDAIECLCYVCENARHFAVPLVQSEELLSVVTESLLASDESMQTAAAYFLSLLWKVCAKEKVLKKGLDKISHRIFEACAQSKVVAAYCIHMCF